MCIIIRQKMNLYWIIGLLVLWTGVATADNVTAAPGVSTTSNEVSAFIISIKITNRIYNESLKDHNSENYKTLRQDVENMFFEIYSSTSSLHYQEITEMKFSNGSVIANSTVIFGSKLKSGQTVKDIFVTKYKQQSSLPLDLKISYTADQEPILVPHSLETNIPHSTSSLTTSITSPNIYTSSELTEHSQAGNENSFISTTLASTTIGSDKSMNDSDSKTTTTKMHTTTENSDFTTSFSNITTDNSSGLVHSNTFTSTMLASSLSTMTTHLSKTDLTTHSSPLNTTEHPKRKTTVSGFSPLNTTTRPNNNISTMSASRSSTTTVHSTSHNSATSASISSVNPGKTVTQKPTEPKESDTVATDQSVPGWGIAILVLAAIILFFMLVLLILLLLFWCCWWKQRGFMNVSDPDPTGYYNPDIPMYSTHSTYDSHNGKSLVAGSERPSNNQTGMYALKK